MRRLHAITLCDFGRFADARIDLDGRLVGVVGPNGAGKSTVIRALLYAYTGELVRWGRRNPARLDRSGARQPHVRLDFVANDGAEATVVRWLPDGRRDGRRRLVTHGPGGVNTTDSDAVNRWFERDAGATPRACAEVLFVRQGELADVVTDQPARRAELLHRLFGLEAAEEARRAALDALDRVPPAPAPEGLTAARARAAELAAQLDQTRLELMGVPPADPDYGASLDRLALAARARALVPAAERARAELAASSSRLAADPLPAVAEVDVYRAQEAARKCAAHRASAADRAARAAAARAAEVDLAAVRAAEPPDPGPAPEVPPELATLRPLEGLYRAVAACRVGGDCPVCGAVLAAGGESTRQAAREALAALADAEARFDRALSGHRSASTARARWVRTEATLAAAAVARTAERDAAAVSAPAPTEWEGALEFRLPDLQTALEAHRRDLRERAAALARRDRAAAEVERLTAEVAGAPGPDECVRLKARVDAESAAAERRRTLRARAEVLAESHRQAAAAVGKIEAVHRAADRDGPWRRDLDLVARGLHRDAAPARAAAEYLRDLAGDLNDRLSELAGGFTVEVDAAGAAAVRKGAGPAVPVEMASGGEQAVLAIAWRLATADRVAPGANFLCLDEPTYGLDRERLEALRAALDAWRPADDRQFVVVTHDRRLAGVFDRLVEL